MTIDDDTINDLYWHSLNYRTAGTLEAEGMWQELRACVDRLIAEEREACAKVCDSISNESWKRWKEMYYPHDEGLSDGAAECADLIRNRSPIQSI